MVIAYFIQMVLAGTGAAVGSLHAMQCRRSLKYKTRQHETEEAGADIMPKPRPALPSLNVIRSRMDCRMATTDHGIHLRVPATAIARESQSLATGSSSHRPHVYTECVAISMLQFLETVKVTLRLHCGTGSHRVALVPPSLGLQHMGVGLGANGNACR